MFRTFAVFAAMLLFAGVAVTALGQTTATITGTVNDESGNIFPGATIVATNTASGFTHTAVAGADGRYTLAGLPAANYRIDVTAPSYKGTTREVRVLVGQSLEMNFRLTPDLVLMEQITVVGSTAVETETSEVATNVTRQQIEGLPQNDRNFLNFAALAPGVQLGTDPERKVVKGGAQSADATNVFIDGVSFKNDVIQGGTVGQDSSKGNPFPQNAVQEFRVITQNYSAEYQKASSAINTAVTKSGSNSFTGDAFYYFQDKGLVAENPVKKTNPEYERSQYGLSFGGPIIQDKMHFFGSYEANDQDREDTVTVLAGYENDPGLRARLLQEAGTFVSPFRSDLAFAKVSFQPGASQLLDWSGNYRKETDIKSFGGQTSRQSAENVKNDVFGTTLRHQLTSNTILNEFSISYQDYKWNPTSLDTSAPGFAYERGDLNTNMNTTLRIGGRSSTQDIGQQRISLRDDLSFSNLQFVRGQHNVKIGGNVDFLDYTFKKQLDFNPTFYFRDQVSSTIPYKARFGVGNPDLSAENTQYGIYGQDDWSVTDQLTLNLGLRWDYETDMFNTDYVTPPAVRAALADDFPAHFFSDGNDREPKSDMFQPRIGFSYDVTRAGKTIVFGGAGRYYDRMIFNNTIDETFKLQYAVADFYFSADGSPVLGNPAAKWDPKYLTREGLRDLQLSGITGKPEVFLLSNDTPVPYSDQFNIGVRQSFGQMVASATYANIRSYNGLGWVIGKGMWSKAAPDPAFGNVFTSDSDIKTWYDAVYLTLDRPYTDQSRFGFNVAYTWADAEQIGNTDPFNFDRQHIRDYARYGTPGTQQHRIVASGIVGLPWQTRLSSLIQYGSGDRFRVHDFPNGFCGDNNCYVPRSGEGPSWTTVDLRAEKDFSFGTPYRFGLIAEAFNLFNEERFTGFDEWGVNNPNEGKPNDIISGTQRRYQFGVRVGF